MLRGSRHLGKILGYSFSHLSLLGSLASRRTWDIWRRQWELLENRVYNKPNGCSANRGWLRALITNNNPCTGLDTPWGFQEVEVPRFQDNLHTKEVRLSSLRIGRIYPQALICVTGWFDPRDIVRPEGLCQWEIPMTTWGIEPATFRLVTQC
jgi:hypothetical protein